MDDAVICIICMEQFDEGRRIPKSLICGHTFCLQCLMCIAIVPEGPKCPLCNQVISTYPLDLPTNYNILSVALNLKTLPDLKEIHVGNIPRTLPDPKEIHVGNIPLDVTDDDIRAFFSRFGKVTSVSIHHSFKSKESSDQLKKVCYAFVSFHSEQSAEKLLKMKFIFYKDVHKLRIQKPFTKGHQSKLSSEPHHEVETHCYELGYPDSHTVVVHGVPRAMSLQAIKRICSRFGAVQCARKQYRNGRPTGLIFVIFEFSDSARLALNYKYAKVNEKVSLRFSKFVEKNGGSKHASMITERDPPCCIIV